MDRGIVIRGGKFTVEYYYVSHGQYMSRLFAHAGKIGIIDMMHGTRQNLLPGNNWSRRARELPAVFDTDILSNFEVEVLLTEAVIGHIRTPHFDGSKNEVFVSGAKSGIQPNDVFGPAITLGTIQPCPIHPCKGSEPKAKQLPWGI